MKLSVVIAALNEELRLPDALASVTFANEVVVLVDGATTDATATVAENAGAKVFTRRFDGYATQKNFAIDQATNDWILILDADERVTPELAASIQAISNEAEPVAYEFSWRNFLGKKWLSHGGLYPDRHIRLFDRRQVRYGPREIHERLEIKGTTDRLEGDIIHLTYADTRDYLAKVNKYASLEAKWTKDRPTLRSIPKEFLNRYITLEGYKDGWAGLVSAALLAYYRVILRRGVKPS